MSDFFKESMKRTKGLVPFLVMLCLLVLTEALLHVPAVRDRFIDLSESLWLEKYVSVRAGDVLPLHQDLAEQAINEAYFRGLNRAPEKIKIIVAGDSTIWQVPEPPAFHQLVDSILDQFLPRHDIGVYSLAMPGMNHVAGFYALKAMTREFRPDMIVYVANPLSLGKDNHANCARDIGFIDTEFMSPSEEIVFRKLIKESKSPGGWDKGLSFNTARMLFQTRHGSALRELMLPPAVFMRLSTRCYFVQCQDTKDVYWRVRMREKKDKRKTRKFLEHMTEYDLSEESVNYVYLMLISDLLEQRGVNAVMLIPPRNTVMIEEYGVSCEPAALAEKLLVERLEDRGVKAINCSNAVPETLFRDNQHLRPDGFKMWVDCVKGPLVENMKKSMGATRVP